MRVATFTLLGTPSSSNSTGGHHWAALRSAKGRQWEWQDRAAIAIAQARKAGAWDGLPFERAEIEVSVWVPDRRRRDCDGLVFGIKGSIDRLHPAVFPDDDWQHVPSLSLRVVGVDKARPRVEVLVREIV